MQKITTPHDRFFRASMSNMQVAKSFFANHLPEHILKTADLETLALCKESFVDKHLAMSITDILYHIHFDSQQGYIYLLAEHQSQPDPLMPFRLLKYICNIIELHLEQKNTKILPVIYPLVFYHGEKKYRYSTDIMALFGENTELASTIMFKPFQLIDTAKYSDAELKQHHWAGIMEIIMKHIFDRDILPHIEAIMPELRRIDLSGGGNFILTLFNYALKSGKVSNTNKLIAAAQQGLTPNTGDKIMTGAEQLHFEGKKEGREEGKKEGRKEGREEGREETKHLIAKRLLKEGADLNFIAHVTGLHVEEIRDTFITVDE